MNLEVGRLFYKIPALIPLVGSSGLGIIKKGG